MFVITDERLFDLVVLQKFLRLTRIFTRDRRNFLAKDTQSAQRNIFQVSDGCRDDVERARQTLSSVSLSVELPSRFWTTRCALARAEAKIQSLFDFPFQPGSGSASATVSRRLSGGYALQIFSGLLNKRRVRIKPAISRQVPHTGRR
jgi:hypothetical protein